MLLILFTYIFLVKKLIVEFNVSNSFYYQNKPLQQLFIIFHFINSIISLIHLPLSIVISNFYLKLFFVSLYLYIVLNCVWQDKTSC
ncbi:hypothetical protein FORC087_200 (plasmid) [Bacillus cereus]|nr:hypothetical protein FORC087_200 [Bacillus cereus]